MIMQKEIKQLKDVVSSFDSDKEHLLRIIKELEDRNR